MNRRHCAECGHFHAEKCEAINHHQTTDAASKCGCTRPKE